MVRLQIQLTARQVARLRQAARARGVSLSELVRRLVDRGIDDELPDRAAAYARAAQRIGGFRDSEGASDVSSRHDDYLTKAYR
jgi:hypothetical protein